MLLFMTSMAKKFKIGVKNVMGSESFNKIYEMALFNHINGVSCDKSYNYAVNAPLQYYYSRFSTSQDTSVQCLDFTHQTTDITHFALVFHNGAMSN